MKLTEAGFRTLIVEALVLELPVLVGLSALNAEALLEFSGGIAKKLSQADTL